ncbi:hypothetical protein MACJ_003267 [Theileria orientalis]|uniref:Uncharacterized protein n=1 Tax=Theileria orientalis TaxID=68886 RepID=A0A976M7Q2_THEOR|nr:hypothetical protein MACJ_003267 [Theileria orientalis]
MQIVSKRTRTYNKFYDEDYDLELKSVSKVKKPRSKKSIIRNSKQLIEQKKKIRFVENSEPSKILGEIQTNPSLSVNASVTQSNLNQNIEERVNSVNPFPANITSTINSNNKSVDPQVMNNIMNSSSINSESHKKYELENIEFFRRLIVDKYDTYYGEDNRLIGQLPNNLLVNNLDHQFLNPWVDMIMPSRSRPYVRKYSDKSQNKINYEVEQSDTTVTKKETGNKRLLYLTESQVFNILDSILEQIINTPKNVSVKIDWIKVSKAANLSQEVCKDFWWSFDKTHIKDKFGGCMFKPDWYHYYKVDEWYFVDLKNRVQHLLQLASDSKMEREQILKHFANNVL